MRPPWRRRPALPPPVDLHPAPPTLIVHPCGCIYYFARIGWEPCPPHGERTERAAWEARMAQEMKDTP